MAEGTEEAEFVGHEPCPECGSSNNLGRWSDGHAYCFGFNCGYKEPPAEGYQAPPRSESSEKLKPLLRDLEYRGLSKRRITEDTAKHWRYGTTTFDGRPCQVATYYDRDGRAVCQKVRFPDKTFRLLGDTSNIPLYGEWLARDGGKMIIVTEGEIDALSVSQAQGLKWPAVSVPNGAQGAAKVIRKRIEFLERFERVVFMFDMDEPGQEAAKECAALLSPGKAYIASLPLKDANEMLQAGRAADITSAAWSAKAYRPDGIISIDEIMEEAKKPIERGLPWCFPSLTEFTYGRRLSEVYAVGAGTGVGKTDFLTQQIAFDVTELRETVGVIFLEQKPVESAKRLAGKLAGRRFHIPDAGWTNEELEKSLSVLRSKVYFYDSFGSSDWDVIKGKIRYMAVSLGIRLVYVDHLTALADTSREKESLEEIMKEMAGLANELNIIITFVSHLATPDGKPHEEGGRVTIRHFKGSRAIGFWSYFMFGLERNQQADDEAERQTTTFRVLKDRYTGNATGRTIQLGYDETTGRLFEREGSPFTPVMTGDADDQEF